MLKEQLSQVDKLFEMYIKNHHDALKESCSTSLIITCYNLYVNSKVHETCEHR